MKIALHGKHGGLIDLMYDVLQNHDVRIQEPFGDRPLWKGDEDIYIHTFGYGGLKDYKDDKPIIIYATDPIYTWVADDFNRIQETATMILAEDCYPHNEFFPIKRIDYTIPYAINEERYAPYTGEINQALIINRKARQRWEEVVRGATGILYSLEDFLGDIPFDICQITNISEFRKTFPKYKLVFYFSNSPYSIVMFECMTLGIPMVGYNSSNVHTYSPIEKYLPKYGIGVNEIRNMIQEELNKPAQRVSYNIHSFSETVQKWDDAIKNTIELWKSKV